LKKPSGSTELIIGADHGESPPANHWAKFYPKVSLLFTGKEEAFGVEVAYIDFHCLPPEKQKTRQVAGFRW